MIELIRARSPLLWLPVLVRADPAGARQVRAVLPEARLALLVPPTGPGHAPPGPDRDPAERAPPGPKYDTVVVNDLAERAAGELVDFIGCPYLAPAQPGANG